MRKIEGNNSDRTILKTAHVDSIYFKKIIKNSCLMIKKVGMILKEPNKFNTAHSQNRIIISPTHFQNKIFSAHDNAKRPLSFIPK